MSIVRNIQFSEVLKEKNMDDMEKAFNGISMAAGWVATGLQIAGFAGELGAISMEAMPLTVGF
jgi:hypothetical protein